MTLRPFLVAAAAASSVLVGCGGVMPTSTSPASPTAVVRSDPPRATPGPVSVPSTSAAVAVDPSLLDHLPDDVAGFPVDPAPDSDQVAASDPAVTSNAEAVATALAIDPANGEFAHATIVRLRPDVFSAEFFRDWRDTFNDGACSQAGDLIRTAEAEIGGRETFIGTCAGGAHTYHVWLEASRVLVSVTAVGERRFGEQLVGGLHD